ncbi:MAG: SPOR domain-containing protein [Bacteroidales bacterium]|nr:SPOR domain-containing protein [Bacteroidales bacterium]
MTKTLTILILTLAALLLIPAPKLCAQNIDGEDAEEQTEPEDTLGIPEGYELIDTVMYVPAIAVDTNLVGRNIFTELSREDRRGTVRLSQSNDILAVMDTHFVYNADKTLTGYRVRIFFDNKQSSRKDSEATVGKFKDTHPEVPVYWSYVNPYFKVTVGDFRTKSEAMLLLQSLKEDFPAAFIVKESISYPPIDKEHAMVLDTVQIMRAIPGYEETVETLSL